MKHVAITGETFPVKNRLKALGGKWDGELKAWLVPAAKADEARDIVAKRGKTDIRPTLRRLNGRESAYCWRCCQRIQTPGQRCGDTDETCSPAY